MASAPTYTPIATYTTTGSDSSYTFTSIPQTYTDLLLVANLTGVSGNNFSVRVGNNSIDTGTNYSYTRMGGNGSTTNTATVPNDSFITSNITAGSNGSISITNIMNYANTTTYKIALNRFNDAGAMVFAVVGNWHNTAAINQVRFFSTNSVNFGAGSVLTLYGILAA